MARSNAQRRLFLFFLSIHPCFLLSPLDDPPPPQSRHRCFRVSALSDGWTDGREDGGWVGRQETLVTHYDGRASHYMIGVAFFFLRAPCVSITWLNPLSSEEGPTRQRTSGGIPRGKQKCMMRVCKQLTHTHTHTLMLVCRSSRL